MNNIFYYLFYHKKIFAIILSLAIAGNLISSYVLDDIKNADLSTSVYTVSNTLSRYCNMVVDFPVVFVTEFLNSEQTSLKNKQQPIKSDKKQNDKKNNRNKQIVSIVFTENISLLKNIKDNIYKILSESIQLCNESIKIINSTVFMFLLFLVLFKGTDMLARGETEDNILYLKINKINSFCMAWLYETSFLF